MKRNIKITVIGGDMRQLVMAQELAKEGFGVNMYGIGKDVLAQQNLFYCNSLEESVKDCSAVILGVPYSADGRWINFSLENKTVNIKDLFNMLLPGQIVLGGRLNEAVCSLADDYGIKMIDYFKNEELNVLNAIPTAEGALELAMRELDITIHSSKALVLGFGRIGKVLAQRLHALGAQVSVAARKNSDLAWIDTLNYTPCNIKDIKSSVKDTDVIFNTVPEKILAGDVLEQISPNTLIIDLASKPGGVDMPAAKEKDFRVIWALSLPGKVAPVSAGRIIKKTVLNILLKEDIL